MQADSLPVGLPGKPLGIWIEDNQGDSLQLGGQLCLEMAEELRHPLGEARENGEVAACTLDVREGGLGRSQCGQDSAGCGHDGDSPAAPPPRGWGTRAHTRPARILFLICPNGGCTVVAKGLSDLEAGECRRNVVHVHALENQRWSLLSRISLEVPFPRPWAEGSAVSLVGPWAASGHGVLLARILE